MSDPDLEAKLLAVIGQLALRIQTLELLVNDPDDGIVKLNERLDDPVTGLERLDERLDDLESTVSNHTTTLGNHTTTLGNHGDRLDNQLDRIVALEADAHTHSP